MRGPPKNGFKKGQSGNPLGRRKGSQNKLDEKLRAEVAASGMTALAFLASVFRHPRRAATDTGGSAPTPRADSGGNPEVDRGYSRAARQGAARHPAVHRRGHRGECSGEAGDRGVSLARSVECVMHSKVVAI